jgi:hypothetical protein
MGSSLTREDDFPAAHDRAPARRLERLRGFVDDDDVERLRAVPCDVYTKVVVFLGQLKGHAITC